MLIRIHQLRDKIHALQRDLEKTKLELNEEIKNCNHMWMSVNEPFPGRVCNLCGEYRKTKILTNENYI
jgi:hypothetical protein